MTRQMTTLELDLRAPGGEPVDLWRTLISHGFAGLSPTVLDEEHRSLAFTIRVPGGRPRRVRVSEDAGNGGRGGRARLDVLGPRPGPKVVRAVLDGRGARPAARSGPLALLPPGRSTIPIWRGRHVAPAGCSAPHRVRGRREDGLHHELRVERDGSDGGRARHQPRRPGARRRRAALERVPHAGRDGSGSRSVLPGRGQGRLSRRVSLGLARTVADGELDLEAFATATPEVLPDAELEEELLALPGVGPYAAAHIMMMLGRHSRLILDSWTRPKYSRLVGRKKPVSDRQIERRFRPYGEYAGLAFWLFVRVTGSKTGPANPRAYTARAAATRRRPNFSGRNATMTVPLCARGAARPTSSSEPGAPGGSRVLARRAGA